MSQKTEFLHFFQFPIHYKEEWQRILSKCFFPQDDIQSLKCWLLFFINRNNLPSSSTIIEGFLE